MADGKVGRPKGLPKYGGRKKGTPNKRSHLLHSLLEKESINWGKEFKAALDADNIDKCNVLISMLPFMCSKLKEQNPSEDSDVVEDLNQPHVSLLGMLNDDDSNEVA